MSYTLYGTQTSPFVRRLRILLESIPYDFKEIALFEKDDAIKLNKINPLNQVPVFSDGELTIWDSRQIFAYLNAIHRFQNLTWEDENTLTAIEGAMDSGITLLLMKRSNINIDEDKMYINRQKERISSVIKYMTPFMTGEGMKTWNFHTISLYCFLEWAKFRRLIQIDDNNACINFLNAHKDRPIVIATQIPEGK